MSATALQGLGRGEEQGPEGSGHTFESCRVRRKKHVPGVPRLWQLDFVIYTAEDGSFRPPGVPGVQMNHVVR